MLKVEKHLGFDDRWLMAIGIPLVSIVTMIMIFGTRGTFYKAGACGWVAIFHTFIYWIAFRWVLIQYHERFKHYAFNIERLVFICTRLLVTYIVLKFGIGFSIDFFLPSVSIAYEENKVSPYVAEVSELILIALMFFIYEGIYYFNKSRLIEIEKNKLEVITAEQKLDTLKNQVNPHFLFNSLNTVITMIPEEPKLAIEFIQKLSTTYRNILEVRNEKLITLRKELQALDSYIYLLKTRFQGKIQIYNHLDKGIMDNFILPLSLQILIENAVKHNVTSKNNPLKIGISEEAGYIVVQNNLQKKNQQYNSTKMGLANIRSRYKLLINKDIIVEETAESFVVKLPLIKNTEL